MKPKFFELFFRLTTAIVAIVGLGLSSPYGPAMQFWFFTSQTNAFVAVVELISVICITLQLCGKTPKFVNTKWFSILHLMTSFFITITGIIYCFILTPAGVIWGGKDISFMLNIRNIILHAIVPLMSILGYFIFTKKHPISKKLALLFLAYPLCYFVSVILRVAFGGKPFYDGTLYPYFFIDPTINNQGWELVSIWVILISISFYLLALLYIHLTNKYSKTK